MRASDRRRPAGWPGGVRAARWAEAAAGTPPRQRARTPAVRGYSLIELVMAMAIFGFFLFVLLSLTMDLANYERKLRMNFLRHPQIIAVIARMRRDVIDAFGDNPYNVKVDGYKNDDKTLVLETLRDVGGTQIVVWDFSTSGLVMRRAYNVGGVTTWIARGLPPEFTAGIGIKGVENKNGAPGVRLVAFDTKGQVAIDQTFFPRRTK